MLVRIITLVISLLAGVLIGAWAAGPTDPVPGMPAGEAASGFTRPTSGSGPTLESVEDYAAAIRSLNDILAEEVAERLRLEDEVSRLQDQMSEIEAVLSSTIEPASATRENKRMAAARASRANQALSRERLIEAGFSETDAVALKAKVDQIEMDRLYLQDTATREGWSGTPRYREELVALKQRRTDMQSELGDTGYDRYLYAIGQPNRVTVSSILTDSPAQGAGLQAGDHLLSYDANRLFHQGELRRHTTTGQAGTMVPVEVERNGRRMQIYIPRGPLGVRLSTSSVRPEG